MGIVAGLLVQNTLKHLLDFGQACLCNALSHLTCAMRALRLLDAYVTAHLPRSLRVRRSTSLHRHA